MARVTMTLHLNTDDLTDVQLDGREAPASDEDERGYLEWLCRDYGKVIAFEGTSVKVVAQS